MSSKYEPRYPLRSYFEKHTEADYLRFGTEVEFEVHDDDDERPEGILYPCLHARFEVRVLQEILRGANTCIKYALEKYAASPPTCVIKEKSFVYPVGHLEYLGTMSKSLRCDQKVQWYELCLPNENFIKKVTTSICSF